MKSLPKKKQKTPAEQPAAAMPLESINYLMIVLAALVIAGSYWGMYMEKSVDGVFALFISPVTLVGAYVWIIFAVLYRPKAQKTRQS
jgi:hypothetical protein